jgi:hypothetical protein
MVIGGVIAAFSVFFSIWPPVVTAFEELLYFGFVACAIQSFWIREAHAGDAGPTDPDGSVVVMEEPNRQLALVFLNSRGSAGNEH